MHWVRSLKTVIDSYQSKVKNIFGLPRYQLQDKMAKNLGEKIYDKISGGWCYASEVVVLGCENFSGEWLCSSLFLIWSVNDLIQGVGAAQAKSLLWVVKIGMGSVS